MAPALAKFIATRALKVPSATYSVKDLLADFLAMLPPAARQDWPRSRLIAELTASGFAVGIDPRARTYAVAGIAPKAALESVDGRLVAN